MQIGKKKAARVVCPDCGVATLGKFATKRHKCRPEALSATRDQMLEKQRQTKRQRELKGLEA